MHIVVLPSWYKSVENPFMGSFFEEQARALLKAGHKVAVFNPCFFPLSSLFEAKPDYNGNYNDNGLPTYNTIIQGIVPRSRKINNNHIRWKSYQLFKEYINENGKPDILHAHSIFDAGIIGDFLSEKFNIPFVITEHLTHFTGSLSSDVFKKNLAKDIFIHAAKSIAVSNQFKIDLERELDLDSDVFTVVYNMVASRFYESFVSKIYKPGEEFIFLTNSFLNERKNHTLLFDALKILVNKGCNVKLNVGGEGERQTFLEDYVRKIELEKHVFFLGGLSRARVKEEIDKSHAFVLGSKFESFGVVLIESLASGRPVISTNCGGPAEIVDAKSGYLVNSFEASDYATVMGRMIENYNQFEQAKIREYCHERFSEESIAGELIEIYKDVLQKKNNTKSRKRVPELLSVRVGSFISSLFFLE